MKITDLRCALIGDHPIVRIVTDEGLCGHSAVESYKPYLQWPVLHFRDYLIGEDPTDVERIMSKFRHRGGFKPWGSAVSAIEMALWDLAGKAAGLPTYKLLGGKVRDRVRVYNGAIRFPIESWTPEGFADAMRLMRDSPEHFSLIKQGIGFHSAMPADVPDFFYGDPSSSGHGNRERGVITTKGMDLMVACVAAMRDVLGDEVGLALDCGPGFTVQDARRFAKECEPFKLAWMEDLLTGDYTPSVDADLYRQVTGSSLTPIHTGEQIYLRNNFKELIETRAVDVIGPDPCDVGGLAELKWIAEYADLHGIAMAPHGTGDGLFGMMALVAVCATLPRNYIAFEYPTGNTDWWFDIVEGLPDPIVVDSHIAVGDAPGIGLDFRVEEAKHYLSDADAGFFD